VVTNVQEHHLRAVQLLPNIIRLQRLLLSQFNRSIDHAEAMSMKIGTFIEGIRDGMKQHLVVGLLLVSLYLRRILLYYCIVKALKCFNTVGWAAGRASGL